MLHTALFFAFFIPLAFLLERLREPSTRIAALFLANALFISAISMSGFATIIAVAVLSWLCILALRRLERDLWRNILFTSVALLLCILILLKASSLTPLFGPIAGLSFSFFCLPILAALTDAWRRQPLPAVGLLEFLAFATYFPAIVSGPIQRAQGFFPQISDSWARARSRIGEASGLVLSGLFKKLILADRLGDLEAAMAQAGQNGSSLLLLPHFHLFMIRTYFDFSGYTDIARGVSLLIGIELPLNFDRPFHALNPIDFWRRWHISLSHWMRDYVYYPLFFLSKNIYLCFFLTFLCNGLWHAMEWNFFFLGLYWGSMVTGYLLLKTYWDALSEVVQKVLMWQIFAGSFLFFETDGLSKFYAILAGNWSLAPALQFLQKNVWGIGWYAFSACAYIALRSLLPRAGTKGILLLVFTTLSLLYTLSTVDSPGYIYAQF